MTMKRSQIYRRYSMADFKCGELNNYRVPLSRYEEKVNLASKDSLSLCDLTALKRVGHKGSGIMDWCEVRYRISCPEINQSKLSDDGILIARLSSTELLLLEDVGHEHPGMAIWADITSAYTLPRQDSHHCFMLRGHDCAATLAKLCAVDLRPRHFRQLQVAQTTMARVSVIIIRRDIGNVPAYYVLIDSSLAEYLWDCLLDVLSKSEGKLAGLNDIKEVKDMKLNRCGI